MKRKALMLVTLAGCAAFVAQSALAGTGSKRMPNLSIAQLKKREATDNDPASSPKAWAPTLDGERFGAPFWTNSGHVSCGKGDSGKITFDVKGVASGPYPGKFRERGWLTVDYKGNMERFFAKFKIITAAPTPVPAEIIGRKWENDEFTGPTDPVTSEPNDEASSQVTCNDQYPGGADLGIGDFDNGRYKAHIDTLDGDFHDSGKTSAELAVLRNSQADDQIYEIFASNSNNYCAAKNRCPAKQGW